MLMSTSKTYNDKKTDIISIHLLCLFVTNMINYAKERKNHGSSFQLYIEIKLSCIKGSTTVLDNNKGSLISNLYAVKCNTF